MSERMYACVEHYAALGIHRTGGAADRTTAEWIASKLDALGTDVHLDPVPFDHCAIESSLTLDGEPVMHLAVPYEWTGSLDTAGGADLRIARFDAAFGGRPLPLDAAIAELGTPGHPLILATGDGDADLRAINRRIHDGSGVPTVLVAGRDHDRLTSGTPRLTLRAERRTATTTNVFAATPAAAEGAPATVLSTPLNGWFGCAGERGTGIAVLLELVERFVDHPLLIVATGGHELSYFGADRWADQVANGICPGSTLGVTKWNGVVHIGASIAVEEADVSPPRPLAGDRLAMTSLPAADATAMTGALEPANYQLAADTTGWLGEAEVFQRFDLPMLSFTGAGRYFHCPEDTPAASTSPAGLTTAADAIANALTHFLDNL